LAKTEQIVNEILRDALSQYTTCELVLISIFFNPHRLQKQANTQCYTQFFITPINYLSVFSLKITMTDRYPAGHFESNKFRGKN
ncbi:MAG: hypothetical protein JAZ05_13500, partial [Candidatus Thiodiazotropha taylori]|nr:hypothetical protein [Candidatus Thiodiazotropha taylori]MCW4293029.1 hypothetical protein [Candidatus Thiodiazotropha taylori]